MRLKIDLGQWLKHSSFWHNKSDDECIELATNEYGIDVEQALMNMLEREFCTSINNNVVELLNQNIDEE